MKCLGVIPVRLESSRYLNKALEAKIMLKPILGWVIEYAQRINFLDKLIVATNDNAVKYYVLKNYKDVEVVSTTRGNSGTHRAYLAYNYKRFYKKYDRMITFPVDEPLVSYNEINKLDLNFKGDISTLYTNFFNREDLTSKSSCKIVSTIDNYMLYSSRAVIPSPPSESDSLLQILIYKKHVGVFIFKKKFLVNNKGCWAISENESLEQNKFVLGGAKVKLQGINHPYFGVDNKEDVKKLEDRYVKLMV